MSPAERAARGGSSRSRVGAAVCVLLASLAAFFWLSRSNAKTELPEARAIVTASMDYALRSNDRTGRHCVALAVPHISFERWRAYSKEGGEPTLGLADPAQYRWSGAGLADPISNTELRRGLVQAVAWEGERQLLSIPRSWVRPGFEPVQEPVAVPDCTVHIFSEPLIARNLAFIEDDIACGLMCGAGKTLALKRTGGAWRVVAWASSWNVGFDRMLSDPVPDPSSNAYVDM